MITKAKARFGFHNIVVNDCPFCHRTHYHNMPIGEGVRTADCFRGEYLLDFEENSPATQQICTCAHNKDGSIMVYSKTCPNLTHSDKA